MYLSITFLILHKLPSHPHVLSYHCHSHPFIPIPIPLILVHDPNQP